MDYIMQSIVNVFNSTLSATIIYILINNAWSNTFVLCYKGLKAFKTFVTYLREYYGAGNICYPLERYRL